MMTSGRDLNIIIITINISIITERTRRPRGTKSRDQGEPGLRTGSGAGGNRSPDSVFFCIDVRSK